jgi:hypothetical protein
MRNEKETLTHVKEHMTSATISLTPGVRFRASGGPYFEIKAADGSTSRLRIRDSGPFTFIAYQETANQKSIFAWSTEGVTVLNMGRQYRHPDIPALVKGPYYNLRWVGEPKRQKAARKVKEAR